jgi:transketolase
MFVDMRDAFFEELVIQAKQNPDIVILTADHGAFALEDFSKTSPKQYINIGIAEQNMVGVAAGLALSGKIVFIYGIAPFVSLRVLEHLTVDVASLQLPVNVVSVGAGFTYSTDGITHQGLQDMAAIDTIPGMTILNSSDPENTKNFVKLAIESQKPHYIRIEKEKLSPINRSSTIEDTIYQGYSMIGMGNSNLVVITSGLITHSVIEIVNLIQKDMGFPIDVIDLHQIKPIKDELIKVLENRTKILVVEESYNSILGKTLSLELSKLGCKAQFEVLDVGEKFYFSGSSRSEMEKISGISKSEISSLIKKMIGTA